jgi:hypothetical protein
MIGCTKKKEIKPERYTLKDSPRWIEAALEVLSLRQRNLLDVVFVAILISLVECTQRRSALKWTTRFVVRPWGLLKLGLSRAVCEGVAIIFVRWIT